VVASHVAAQILNNIEVGDNGFTFVAKRVASFRVIVAQLRYMVSQLRNCYEFLLWPALKKNGDLLPLIPYYS
jgi:hypothetical protein